MQKSVLIFMNFFSKGLPQDWQARRDLGLDRGSFFFFLRGEGGGMGYSAKCSFFCTYIHFKKTFFLIDFSSFICIHKLKKTPPKLHQVKL